MTANPLTIGNIGDYRWVEYVPTGDVILPDLVQGLARHLLGLRAVNVSWDSGLLLPSDIETENGWTFRQERAVSPPIDEALAKSWPYSHSGFDEWYFVAQLPDDLLLSAYCNWGGLSLADWRGIAEVPSGMNLQTQLERAQPIVVLGEGTTLFAITQSETLVQEFRRIVGDV